MARTGVKPKQSTIRVGEAAEILGVSIDTVRRWEASGGLRVSRSKGGQRLVALEFLADDLDPGLAGKAEIAVAHRCRV